MYGTLAILMLHVCDIVFRNCLYMVLANHRIRTEER